MSVNNFPFIRLSSTKLIFSSFSYSSMQVVSTTSSTVHHRTPKNPKPLRESLQNGTPRASILYRHLRNCDCWRASTGKMLFDNRMAMHRRTQQISWKELGYIANEKLLGQIMGATQAPLRVAAVHWNWVLFENGYYHRPRALVGSKN